MSDSGQDAHQRDQIWKLLGLVEDHPVMKNWLSELEQLAPPRPHRSWFRGRGALAAGLVVAAAVGIGAYLYLAPTHYETQVGEQRDVLLADGSRITLNTNTSLEVRYSAAHRHIELKRGEALFSVHHDAGWPFDVSAGGTVTRALGTEFNVDVRNSRVTISVLEGAVRVAAANQLAVNAGSASNSAEVQVQQGMSTIAPALSKGESVEVRPQEQRVIAGTADLRRIAAWRTRRLEFSDTPLSAATAEFNRYSSTQLVIGSPDLELVRVSGIFQIGNIDGFLFALKEVLGITTLDSPGEIVLVRRRS
jgi:transmembrane sensor